MREKPNISQPHSSDIPRVQVDRHQIAAVDIFDDDFESDDFLGGVLYFFFFFLKKKFTNKYANKSLQTRK